MSAVIILASGTTALRLYFHFKDPASGETVELPTIAISEPAPVLVASAYSRRSPFLRRCS
jgi:hypothetical protein